MEQIQLEATNEQTPPERLRELAKINPTLATLVAANPNATPELLTELADSEEDLIGKNVAENPNTPQEVLWKLGEKYPEEVLKNAVFPLLLLENPNLLEEIPQETMASFLKCSAVPVSFMEWSLKNRKSREMFLSLATNPQTPRTMLEKLAKLEDKIVAKAVELHVNCAGELEGNWQEEFRQQIVPTLTLMHQDSHWKPINYHNFFPTLAAIGLVPEFIFELLAKHEDRNIRSTLASIPSLPVKLLEKLGQDSNPRVRASVARNLSTPAELLERLALDEGWKVRLGVASNPNAPSKTLERLAGDQNEEKEVRTAVAKNPNLPIYMLEKLADDEEVFLGVASNPNAPKTVLENLAGSKLERFPELKMVLGANSNTPVELLEKLGRNKAQIPGTGILSNPSTPTHILEQCASSNRVWMREALASNPQLPESVIYLFAEDKSSRVRKAVATNPKTVVAVLERLSQDPERVVRKAVATNPKATFSILEQNLSELLVSGKPEVEAKALLRYLREKPEGLQTLLELIVKKYSDLTRAIALLHPQMPPKVLVENARSLVWLERCAIAQNPNTPTETLQLLAADGNRIVRAAAKEGACSNRFSD